MKLISDDEFSSAILDEENIKIGKKVTGKFFTFDREEKKGCFYRGLLSAYKCGIHKSLSGQHFCIIESYMNV